MSVHFAKTFRCFHSCLIFVQLNQTGSFSTLVWLACVGVNAVTQPDREQFEEMILVRLQTNVNKQSAVCCDTNMNQGLTWSSDVIRCRSNILADDH